MCGLTVGQQRARMLNLLTKLLQLGYESHIIDRLTYMASKAISVNELSRTENMATITEMCQSFATMCKVSEERAVKFQKERGSFTFKSKGEAM